MRFYLVTSRNHICKGNCLDIPHIELVTATLLRVRHLWLRPWWGVIELVFVRTCHMHATLPQSLIVARSAHRASPRHWQATQGAQDHLVGISPAPPPSSRQLNIVQLDLRTFGHWEAEHSRNCRSILIAGLRALETARALMRHPVRTKKVLSGDECEILIR